MTPKCTLVIFILAVGSLKGISTASYSNVVVQRGPVDYINYNPPSLSFTGAQLAQLSAAPLEQVVSLPAVSSVVSPCVAPCVVPNNPIPALAPLSTTANAKIVGYRSLPNVPVFLANNDEATGYQYAYAVFDEQTGDKKTQSEHSDGSVVQGQYSFIQPDGIRRVVIYTADDLKGFNAIVRNISPEPEHPKDESPAIIKEVKTTLPPCNEVRNEHLTQHDDHHEEIVEEKPTEIEHIEEEHKETHPENVSEQEHALSHEEAHPASSATESNTKTPDAILSYNDVINCLQAKLQGAKNVVSPLTYVLIPSSRGPC